MPMLMAMIVPVNFAVFSPVRSAFVNRRNAPTMANSSAITAPSAASAVVGS